MYVLDTNTLIYFFKDQGSVAKLLLGTPIGPIDVLIAGTVLAHDGILVTHNVQEFRRVSGLRLSDWYDPH